MKMKNINKVKFYTYCRVGSEEKKQKQKQIKKEQLNTDRLLKAYKSV